MSAPFKDLVPMLLCRDVQASIRFYTEVLGFTLTNREDDIGHSGFASLNQGRAQIMLASPSYIPENPKVDGRYTQSIYYFYPEDVVALRERVLAQGHAASDLRVTFYGMKEFEMTDPDGHVLWFGEDTNEPPTPEA